jgi:autotransporter family porin
MNIIYRIVWNKASGLFVVASELSKGKTKSSRSRTEKDRSFRLSLKRSGMLAGVSFITLSSMAHAGLVASGISQSYTDEDVVTTAANDYGIWGVNADGVMNFTGGSINTSGASGYGVVASDNGQVNISGTRIAATGSDARGLYANRNASMIADGVTVTTGTGYGVYAEGNSNLTLTNSNITSGSRGLVAGALSTINVSDTDIQASSQGLYANGATINGERLTVMTTARTGYGVFSNAAAGNISLTDSKITTQGDYGYGLYTVNGTLNATDNEVKTSGINAHAVFATGATGNLSVAGGSLTTTGAGAAGIYASGGGRVTADNLAINSSGAGLSATGASVIDASNVNLTIAAGSSALSADSGATLNGTSLLGQVADNGSLIALSGAASSANTVTLTDSTLNAVGSSAVGINSVNGINQVALTNSHLDAELGNAITLQNGSALNLTLDGSSLGGLQLLDASASGTSAQISAQNGSRLNGNIQVDPAAVTHSQLAMDDAQWRGSANGLQTLTLANGSLWNMTDSSDVQSLTLNNSSVNFDHSNGRSTTLTVDGNYIGTGATLMMNTVLAGDDSDSDRLHVTGDTRGSTDVVVNNAGGGGAQTLRGIELITVDGTSDGIFSQKGRITAGAYDYHLARGEGADSKNWYLTSDTNVIAPDPTPVAPDPTPVVPDPTPVTPEVPGTPDDGEAIITPGKPTETVRPGQMIVRPEVGNYIANIAAANTLFNLRLHDRGGETQYVDALTGEKKLTSLWMRNVGGHQQVRDGSNQLKTETNRYVLQLGGDLAGGSSNGTDSLHLGAMAGYGNARSNTDSNVTGYRSQGHTTGYNLGIYGTWYQQSDQQTGAYLDSWLQYGWFNNSVNGDHLQAEQYKSSGFTASIESGYSWKVGEDGLKNSYFIAPSAQFIWMGVKADDFNEANGTRVSSKGDGNVQSRLGVRASLKTPGETGQTVLTPYVEANWINNSKAFGSTFNGVNMRTQGEKNIGELRVGLDSQLNSDLNLWGSVGQQAGSNQYRDTSAAVGVKISF